MLVRIIRKDSQNSIWKPGASRIINDPPPTPLPTLRWRGLAGKRVGWRQGAWNLYENFIANPPPAWQRFVLGGWLSNAGVIPIYANANPPYDLLSTIY